MFSKTAQPTTVNGKYLRTLRAVGFTGALISIVTIAVTAAFIGFVSAKLLGYMEPVFKIPSFPRKTVPFVKLGITYALWLPIIPVVLASAFLPVRLAWIHGRVRIGDFFDGFGDAFSRSIYTLKLTIRQLIIASLPFIGITALLNQGDEISADPQLIKFLAVLAVAIFGYIIWQAAAIICAVPIAIVSQCTAYAAATETRHVIRARHRLIIFALLIALSACIFGGMVVRLQRWDSWQIEAAMVAIGAVVWVLVTCFGVVCIDASIAYLKIKANEPKSPEATQFNPAAAIPGGIQAVLPNGQPVTIHIQNLNVPPRN